MAYNYSTARHQIDSAVVTAYPFTMACWAHATNLSSTVSRNAICLGRSTSGVGHQQSIGFSSTTVGGVYAQSQGGLNAATTQAITTSNPSANKWHHLCGVFTSATERAAFLDGGSKGTEATSQTFQSTIDRTVIGQRLRAGAYDSSMVGHIAECCIWNVALTDDEVFALWRGFKPSTIRPDGIVMYVPLIREVIDLANSKIIGATGSVTVIQHPRRYG